MKQRAAVSLVVIAALAVLGVGGLWLTKPALFGGASKRAAASTAATAQLDQAVVAQGAAAAASVVKIAEANALAPESPARAFIGQETTVTLSRLPPPDPRALLEAERRRAAVMEGRLDEARRLYEAAAKKSETLQRERDEALAARRAADLALESAAAAAHARTVQALGVGVVAVLALAAFAYVKLFHVSPAVMGTIAADIRHGVRPIQAITDNLAPRQYGPIQKAAKLAAELDDGPPAEVAALKAEPR
jgi:hypothetical protein